MGIFDSIRDLFGGSDASEESRAGGDDDPERRRDSSDETVPGDDDPEQRRGSTDEPGRDDEVTAADFRERAEESVEDWDDYDLDFSVESLSELDEFAAGQGDIMGALHEEMDDGNELVEQLHTGYTVDAGSYLGEVIVRQFDGQWVEDEDGWTVVVEQGGEVVSVPVFDVAAQSFAEEPIFREFVAETLEGAPAGGGGSSGKRAATAGDAGAGATGGAGGVSANGGVAGASGVDEGAAGDLRMQVQSEAAEFVDFWDEADLDYTPESLARLDDLVDRQWEKERFRDATYGDTGTMDGRVYTGLVRQLGAYYGEVLVRTLDAEWIQHEQFGTAVEVRGAGTEDDAGEDASESGEGDDAESLIANVFHIAEDCLTEPSKFALSYDTTTEQLGLDVERISEGGEVLTVDTEEAEAAAEEMDATEVVRDFRNDAAELVENYPDYDFDYTPESLERLDRLATEEFDDFDLADAELGAQDGDSLFLTAHAMETGGYLAEVFRRNLTAEWMRDAEGGVLLVVQGNDGEARIDPVGVAAECLRGEDSFAATYEALRGRLSVEERDEPVDVGPPTLDEEPGGPGAQLIEDPALVDFERQGEEFASEWPSYDLDFSVASLDRLDDLVAAEYDHAEDDVDRDATAAGGLDSMPEGATLSLVATPATDAVAGYLATVARRQHAAQVTIEDDEAMLVVDGPDGTGETDLLLLVSACFSGYASFSDAYDQLLADAGLATAE